MRLKSISIVVRDIDRMTEFYERAFSVLFKEVITRGRSAMFGTLPGGMTLKFIVAEESDPRGPATCLGIAVRDVEGVAEVAQELGGALEGEILRNGDLSYARVFDPDGNLLELYTES